MVLNDLWPLIVKRPNKRLLALRTVCLYINAIYGRTGNQCKQQWASTFGEAVGHVLPQMKVMYSPVIEEIVLVGIA